MACESVLPLLEPLHLLLIRLIIMRFITINDIHSILIIFMCGMWVWCVLDLISQKLGAMFTMISLNNKCALRVGLEAMERLSPYAENLTEASKKR